MMKFLKRAPKIIVWQSVVAMLWSLYYGWFGDPVQNYLYQERFVRGNGLNPCQMCWFARILMYPIVLLSIISLYRKDTSMYVPILILSWLGIVLETYQYWYQLSHSNTEIKSFICGVGAEASCAATDVIYAWFITIPFLCLVAFIVIFVLSIFVYRHYLSHKH